MNTIVKIFTGKYIDLSKIVSISDAYFMDRMGHGGYFVGFDIECQLLEKPIRFERRLTHDEVSSYTAISIRMDDAPGKGLPEYYRQKSQKPKDILAVANLQKEIDVIVRQWMDTKGESFPETE